MRTVYRDTNNAIEWREREKKMIDSDQSNRSEKKPDCFLFHCDSAFVDVFIFFY